MKCIICSSKSRYYFSKRYTEPYIASLLEDVGDIEYYKCDSCGFVLSRTHHDMDDALWAELNFKFHHMHEKSGIERDVNQPPYLEQAAMLSMLGKMGIVDIENMLDFAAGYGYLSRILRRYFSITLPVYDPYVEAEAGIEYVNKCDLEKYSVVVNSAMFEHIRYRADLDQVFELVKSDGVMIIHTLVCENVPNDPDWFYLRPPVHTAFHTNASMRQLMDQWGFKSSIYSPKSKCWVLLRRNIEQFEDRIEYLNHELQSQWFYFKDGFVDYWKGF